MTNPPADIGDGRDLDPTDPYYTYPGWVTCTNTECEFEGVTTRMEWIARRIICGECGQDITLITKDETL